MSAYENLNNLMDERRGLREFGRRFSGSSMRLEIWTHTDAEHFDLHLTADSSAKVLKALDELLKEGIRRARPKAIAQLRHLIQRLELPEEEEGPCQK